jgi:hypothetical protein
METDFRAPIAPTKPEMAVVLRELEKLLEDDLFRRSSRYSALLRYIVEKSLNGQSADLKERTIGINVFRRTPDYDTNDDPVVRFCASEIRKRLAQYYRSHPGSPVEIHLNLGSYVPVFRQQASSPSHFPQPSGLLPVPSNGTSGTESAVETPLPDRSIRSRHRSLIWIAASALLLLLTTALIVRFRHHDDPVTDVWAPFLNHALKVTICTGTPPPDPSNSVETPGISIEDHYRAAGHRVSVPTAAAIAKISGFLQAQNQHFDLSEAESTRLENLRSQPVVLVNANNNKWTLLLLKSTRFHFESSGSVASIVDSDNPARHDWSIDFSKPYTPQSTDYAIVARLLDGRGGSPTFIVAGISSNGTEAAGAFSVSPSSLAELARRAPLGWEKMNFEAVLKVQVVQGHAGPIEIEATQFWPRSADPNAVRAADSAAIQ